MALSMEEQRILTEIEQNLTRAEPVLAARLSRLGSPHPSLAGVLRSPRGRLLAGLAALATLMLMSLLVYLMISLRGMPQRAIGGRPAATPQHRVLIAPAPRAHRGSAAAPRKTAAHPAAAHPGGP